MVVHRWVVRQWMAPAVAVVMLAGGMPMARAATETTAPVAVERVAAEGAAEETPNPISRDLLTASMTIGVFVVLLIILRAVAWKPILTGLKSRENSIRESIEAAATARADVARTTKELEAKITEAQQQATQQITQARTDAQRVADTIKKQAETEANGLRDRAVKDIESAKQQALAEINAHAAEIGTAIARKILQRQVNVEDQNRLVDESLGQLGGLSQN